MASKNEEIDAVFHQNLNDPPDEMGDRLPILMEKINHAVSVPRRDPGTAGLGFPP